MYAANARMTTHNNLRTNPTVLAVNEAIETAVKKVNCYSCTIDIPKENSEAIVTYFRYLEYHVIAITKPFAVELKLRWDCPV